MAEQVQTSLTAELKSTKNGQCPLLQRPFCIEITSCLFTSKRPCEHLDIYITFNASSRLYGNWEHMATASAARVPEMHL